MWRTTKILASFCVPLLILLGYLALWVCKFNQWDSLAYVTIVPFWMWAVLGIVISVVALVLIRSRFCWFVLGLWLVTGLAVSLEARGLFRQVVDGGVGAEPSVEGSIRLATINCHSGNMEAAIEAEPLDIDLLLLQEAPSRSQVAELCRRLYGDSGSFVMANSAAMVGRGKFLTFAEEKDTATLHGRFKHESGALIDVSNVSLRRSIPRWELWNRSVREQLRDVRIANRRAIRGYIGDYPINDHQPVRIVAGSFSTPPGDDIFRPMKQAGLRDAFALAGRGTGNTYPNNRPILRLNQIWVSPDAKVKSTATIRSEHGDQRIVVCELVIE